MAGTWYCRVQVYNTEYCTALTYLNPIWLWYLSVSLSRQSEVLEGRSDSDSATEHLSHYTPSRSPPYLVQFNQASK